MQRLSNPNERYAEDFKDHEATFACLLDAVSRNGERSTLLWSRPNTGMYRIRYEIDGTRLLVTGDCGYAIYVWSCPLTWDFLAGCSLDYFAGKCVASEYGRGYQTWDQDAFQSELESVIREHEAEGQARGQKMRKTCTTYRADSCSSRHEWMIWLNEYGLDAFGNDYYEWADLGTNVSGRCHAHLLGLRMAVAQKEAASA